VYSTGTPEKLIGSGEWSIGKKQIDRKLSDTMMSNVIENQRASRRDREGIGQPKTGGEQWSGYTRGGARTGQKSAL
jgi:hypothetical protein